MAVVHSGSQAERINTLLDDLQAKMGQVSGELRSALEHDLAELRSSVNDLVDARGEGESVAQVKGLQAMLAESEARYRELGENISDPLAIFGADLRLIYRNKAAEQASHISNEQALGRSFEDLYPKAAGTGLHDAFLRAAETRQVQTYMNHWIHPGTGKDCYYEVTYYPGRDWIVAISKNVTERENALEALRQSEKFNRQLIESSSDSIKVLDLEGSLISINSAGLGFLEMDDTSALIGRNWLTLWEENCYPILQSAMDAACSGRVGTFQAPRKSFQGTELWWDVVISPIYGPDDTVERLLVVSRDITMRKQAEAALEKSEAQARQQLAEIEAIYTNAPIGLCVFDNQLRWQRLNQRIAEINGVPLEDHIGKTPREVVPDVGQQAEDALKQILETGQPLLDFEMTGTTAAQPGVVRFWNERWTPIKDEDGTINGISVAAEEITERKRAEEELRRASEILRESEGRFRTMANGTPILLWVHDAQGELEFVNRAWTDYFGITLEEVKQTGWTPLVHPDDAPEYEAYFHQCTEERAFFHAQTRVRSKDGEWRVVDSHAQPRFSETGEFLGMVGSSIDITDQVQAETAVRKSEEKFAKAFHSSPVAMAITRLADGRYIDANDHTCRLLGFTREEILNKTTLELNVYKTEAERLSFLELLRAQGRIREHQRTIYNRDGEPITALLSFEKIEVDGEECILAAMMDVTEQKRIEAEREALLEELRVQKDLLERLIEFSPIAIAMLKGPEYRYVLVNPALRALFPTIEEYVGLTVEDIWPENMEIIRPVLDQVYQTGEPYSATDAPWMTDKGSGPEESFYSFSYTPLFAADGTIEGILVLAKETTEQVRIRQRLEAELEERRRVEVALSESEEKLRSAFENATIGFAMTAADNRFIDANPAYCALTGYSLEELHEIPFQRLVHPDDQEQNVQFNERLLSGEFDSYVIENRYVRKNGQAVWVKKNISLVRTADGKPKWHIALVEDISERKQAEAALEQAHNDLINERNLLQAVMEALPVGLAIYNEVGGVIQANPGYEAVWGSPRPPAESLDDYEMYKAWWMDTGKRVQSDEWASAKSIFTGEPVVGQYLRIQRFDGTMGYVLNSGAPVRDTSGKIIGGAVAIMDMTERVQIEKALRESQYRFRVAMASVPLMVYTCDREQRTTWVYNPPKGYSVDDLLGKRDDEVLPSQDVAELMAAKQQALDTGQGGMQEIKMNAGGEERYFILTTDPIRNAFGEVTGLTCASIDITEQKRLEIERQEVQMQIEVQRRLMDQREKERQGIARDIHDGPIQTLASTAFNIQFIKESFPDPTLSVELNQISLNVKSAIRELREVVNDLRPPSILRFGLSRAIMMHAEDLRERYPDVNVELALDEDGMRLSDQACLTLFRVFQEGMNNIFHHAGATQVRVRYETVADDFILEMRDNGSGFTVPKDFSKLTGSGHYGLAGMNERVVAVGGTLTIKSQPGRGTTITVRGPLTGANVK